MNGIVVRVRGRLGVLVIGSIAAAAIAAPAAGARDQRCATLGKTLAANSVARVYAYTPRPTGTEIDVFGCLYGQAPIKLAGASVTGNPTFLAAVSGRYAALATDLAQPDFGQAELRVYDLRTGQVVLRPQAATKRSSQTYGIRITAVVLSGNTVAWIASIQNFKQTSAPTVYEVHRAEQGTSRVLDSGTKIKPRSLALSSDGRWMYWLDHTKVHRASMR